MNSFVICSGICMLIYLDAVNIVKNTISYKAGQLKRLYSMVKISHSDRFTILRVMVKMIIQALWLSMIQKMNNSVVRMENDIGFIDSLGPHDTCSCNQQDKINVTTYVVSYVLKGKMYKMAVKHKKGPPKVMAIIEGDKNDITDLVLPYMGPEHDFHDMLYTPAFFKKHEITFELFDGTSKKFGKDEPLIV